MKKIVYIIPLVLILTLFPINTFAAGSPDISIDAPYAILMEKETGSIIYEKDAYTHRSPASVTKIMTLLLAAEAVASGKVALEDTVTASSNAASMGGSQIWLEEGESMSFGEMLKCICVVSANDCCVAVAEHLSGSEEAFVEKMNSRAKALGLNDTHFTCCSGLSDSDEHYSCARDLAIIARELLKYDFIKAYAGIWTDSIRNGEFVLNNTNKLIRSYAGATGLKTGFTSKAMHCLAASAERDNVEYIAVILGAESSAQRFESAKELLSYGFANYTLLPAEKFAAIAPLKVSMGKSDCVNLSVGEGNSILIPKDKATDIKWEATIPESISAPVDKGQNIGYLTITSGDETIAEVPILAAEAVEVMGFIELFFELIAALTLR